MDHTVYDKQTLKEPLFPLLFWSRPENKRMAGKLLVVGGNSFGFTSPAQAYDLANKAGAGEVKGVLPDAIQKIVGGFFENAIFLPSTPSGSFAKAGLSELVAAASWSDTTLVAGDIGKNSETIILFEEFLATYTGPLVLSKDVISQLLNSSSAQIDRENTVLILTLEQLQKLAIKSKFARAFTFEMPVASFVENLRDFSKEHDADIVVKRNEHIFIAAKGRVSSTALSSNELMWRNAAASHSAVWSMQFPEKRFEALNCAIFAAFSNSDKI